jgi:hypothetical protein
MGTPKADDGSRHHHFPRCTFTPKQLQLDKQNGKLYWSDRDGMRMTRSNVDGLSIETPG